MKEGSAEDALLYFLDILWTLLTKHIPRKQIQCTRSSHPWLNSRCREAVTHKNNSEGSDNFLSASSQCTQVLFEERQKYVEKLKVKLAALPKGSKQWWRINRELLHRKANISAIPPLKDGTCWFTDAKAKADVFAKKFASKNELPPEVVDTPFLAFLIWNLIISSRFVLERQGACSRNWTCQKLRGMIRFQLPF